MDNKEITNIINKLEANIIHKYEVANPDAFANSRYLTLTQHLRKLEEGIDSDRKFALIIRRFLEFPHMISMHDYVTLVYFYRRLPVNVQENIADRHISKNSGEYIVGLKSPMIHKVISRSKGYSLGYYNLMVLWDNFNSLTSDTYLDSDNLTPTEKLLNTFEGIMNDPIYNTNITINDWINDIAKPLEN